MAIFANKLEMTLQPALRETADYLYLYGQAHTKATLKPLFGNFMSAAPTTYSQDLVPEGSRYAFGPLAVNGAVSNNSSAQLCANTFDFAGGFNLTNSLNIEGGGQYLTSPCTNLTASTPMLIKVDANGKSVQVASMHTNSLNYKILFENSTHVFLFGQPAARGALLSPVSAGAGYYLVSISKSDMSMTVLTPNTGVPGSNGSYYSSEGTNTTAYLIDYDPVNLKATFAYGMHTQTSSTYKLNFKSANPATDASSTHLVVLDASNGAGSISYVKLADPTGYAPLAGVARTQTFASRSFPVKNGLRTFFIMEDTSQNRIPTIELYGMTYDPTGVVPTTGIKSADIPRSMPGSDYMAKRSVIRVLERDNEFYVFAIVGINKTNIDGAGSILKIHAYKGSYDDPHTLTFLSTYEGKSANNCYDYLDITGDATQLMAIYRGANADILVWNEAAETFALKASLPYQVRSAMVDSMERLWFVDQNNSLHIQGPSVGNTIRVGFESSDLSYTGELIQSNVLVSCFNYMGDRVANNITVQLEGGAAVFSNGSTKITVMSEVSGDLKIPFTVNNNGYIRVVANMAI